MASIAGFFRTKAAAGSSAPTADAGSDQAIEGRSTVTLDGSGSTAGSTFAWTLASPTGANVTSLLSSATAQSPTFTPQDIPGLYSAKVAVTKGGETSHDSSNVRVGIYGGTWIRLIPAQAASTVDSGNYGSTTWSDDGTWTTLVLGPRSASIANLTDTQMKWFNSSLTDAGDIQSIEFRIQFRPDYTQPSSSKEAFVGVSFGDDTAPGDSQSVWAAFRADDSQPADATRLSMRQGGTSSFSWQNTASGYDTAYFLIRTRMGRGRPTRLLSGKYSSASGLGSNSGEIVTTVNANWASNALKIGLFGGRIADVSGDITMKFRASYRVTLNEAI